MARKVIRDEIIPAKEGMAFELRKGQVLRIHLVEDMQVGDCVFFNAHDYKEWFHVGQSWVLNNLLGTGTAKSFKHFYSKAPRENVMLTVLEDTVKNHSGNNAARCSRRMIELTGRVGQERSCDQNLAEALAPHGLTADDVPDVFNVFMNTELREDGTFKNVQPTAMKGDYIDLLAEMDILAAISACPSITATNDFNPKPLGVTILQ